MRGKFVTFEGMEGSGKSTQVRAIESHYQKAGKTVFATREPGGTILGNELRALLLQSRSEPIDPMAELFLMEAARAQHVAHVLTSHLAADDLVLCDRYTDASLAYQGGGRGIAREWVAQASDRATGGLKPHLTILLDLPEEEALKRAMGRIEKSKGKREDRFEQEALAFHQRVRKTYLEIAKAEPKRFLIVSALLSRTEIEQKIIQQIDLLLRRQ